MNYRLENFHYCKSMTSHISQKLICVKLEGVRIIIVAVNHKLGPNFTICMVVSVTVLLETYRLRQCVLPRLMRFGSFDIAIVLNDFISVSARLN